MRIRSRHSLRTLRTQRSAQRFAFGVWIGVRAISMPSLRKTHIERAAEISWHVGFLNRTTRPPAAVNIGVARRSSSWIARALLPGPGRAYTRTTQALSGASRRWPVVAGSVGEEMPALAGDSGVAAAHAA